MHVARSGMNMAFLEGRKIVTFASIWGRSRNRPHINIPSIDQDRK
jgi:hypothetical protein